MAQLGRRASFRYSLLRVRLPLPPSDGVAQLERAPGRDPGGWQFESARYRYPDSMSCLEIGQHRPTAGRKREDLDTKVRLLLLAYLAFQPGHGGMAQSGRRTSARHSFLRVQVPLPPLTPGSGARRAVAWRNWQRECLLSTGLQVRFLSLPFLAA